jgi:ribosomal protein L24E
MSEEIKTCDYCGTQIKGQGLIYILPEKQETLCITCFVKVFIRDAAEKEARHIQPTVPQVGENLSEIKDFIKLCKGEL